MFLFTVNAYADLPNSLKFYDFNNTDSNTRKINSLSSYLEHNKQDAQFKLLTAAPGTQDLFNREINLYSLSGVQRQYTKISDTLYYITYNLEGASSTWTGQNTFGNTSSTLYGKVNIVQTSTQSPAFVRGLEIVHPSGTGDNGGYIGISMIDVNKGGIICGDDDSYNDLCLQYLGGNVGIGTSSPTEELEVNGTVKASSIDCNDKHWEMINSSSTLTAGTTFSFTGLDGNTDVEYKFIFRIVGGNAATTLYWTSCNNDTAQNYGYNNIYASGGGAPASEVSTTAQGLVCGITGGVGHLSMFDTTMYAKSGHGRTLSGSMQNRTIPATKTISYAYFTTSVWSNTADNITSITVWASQTNGIGVGSYFEIWAKR